MVGKEIFSEFILKCQFEYDCRHREEDSGICFAENIYLQLLVFGCCGSALHLVITEWFWLSPKFSNFIKHVDLVSK